MSTAAADFLGTALLLAGISAGAKFSLGAFDVHAPFLGMWGLGMSAFYLFRLIHRELRGL